MLSRRVFFPVAGATVLTAASGLIRPGSVSAAPAVVVRHAEDLPSEDLERHETYMRAAISEAVHNPRYPFGAVIVDRVSNRLVARGVNRSRTNPTLHGEMVAIDDFAASGRQNWTDTTLYTTGEPCAMCMSAIAWCGISQVVWATAIADIRAAGIEQIDLRAAEVAEKSSELYPDGGIELIDGVLRDVTDPMFLNRPR